MLVFLGVMIVSVFAQYVMVQYGGASVGTTSLTTLQWIITVLIATLSFPVNMLVNLIYRDTRTRNGMTTTTSSSSRRVSHSIHVSKKETSADKNSSKYEIHAASKVSTTSHYVINMSVQKVETTDAIGKMER
jgi:hypothetical protein